MKLFAYTFMFGGVDHWCEWNQPCIQGIKLFIGGYLLTNFLLNVKKINNEFICRDFTIF